jgi:hypothetical protein
MGLKQKHMMVKKSEATMSHLLEQNEEENNPNEFQDSVLSCLSDLQHLATTMKEKANLMEDEIRRFRTSIHGEDIDAQEI